jgi:predicted nuclease of predicted toxin-antitoxin system
MAELPNYEWHEFPWDSAPKMPPGPHKKLKLYADANIPRPIIKELVSAGLSVRSAFESGSASHSDEDIYQQAGRLHRVLLTMDRDFWDDRKHSLPKSLGVIFVDVSPDQPEKAIDGLARFYALFAKYYPLDWWRGTKARVSERGFVLRVHTWEGRISEEEFRLNDDGKLFTRTLR